MTDPLIVFAVAATFLFAGTVKGVVGLGLPSIALALLTTFVGLTEAMALLLVPSLATNVWQALGGGHGRAIIARVWPFLLAATVAVWIGALALTRIDLGLLSALLGLLLALYGLLGLARFTWSLAPRTPAWVGPVLGLINGILTGMTGSFAIPGVPYLQAIGLPRDQLIQAMGMLFALSTAALAVALRGNGLLPAELGVLSSAGLVPALIGMVVGRRVRARLPEKQFRRAFFFSLMLLGIFIFARAAL
jgi:uncharacterized membrane protein YfcA